MSDDSLFRVALKGLILDEAGRALVVKESGRPFWDLPGGGIEHGETLEQALARELFEEVNVGSDFEYELLTTDGPHLLSTRAIYQLRLVYKVAPKVLPTGLGIDADAVAFIDPRTLKGSEYIQERAVFEYWQLAM